MKTRNMILWNVVVALALLLGAGAGHAEVIFDPSNTTQAIGIDNLDVDGTTYNVDFTTRDSPQEVYGEFPGVLDFNDASLAEEAHDAVDNALNAAGAETVAAEGEAGETVYIVGYEAIARPDRLAHLVSLRDGSWGRVGTGDETIPWIIFFPATKIFATFTDTNPVPVSVPDVVDLPEANAIADIEAEGLVAVVDEQFSDTVPEGNVISQDPVAGTMVDVGSEVTIVVSTGEQQQQVSVPDVVNLPEASAIADIEAEGLVAVVDEQFSDTVPEGNVISQDPEADTMVDVGSEVIIVVSTGATPQTMVNFDPMDDTKAIGIDNLLVNDALYNVAFTTLTTSDTVYGEFPGSFDFDHGSAQDANDAINVELNATDAATVGAEELQVGEDRYAIGFTSFNFLGAPTLGAWSSDFDSGAWDRIIDGDFAVYELEERVFADFTPAPEPGATLSMVAALVALGVIRRWRRMESEGTA